MKITIIIGAILFAIPAMDLYTHCPDQVYNWHRCLSVIGWIGFIGFLICFVIVIAMGLNLIKRK